jgi:hypothetical protein
MPNGKIISYRRLNKVNKFTTCSAKIVIYFYLKNGNYVQPITEYSSSLISVNKNYIRVRRQRQNDLLSVFVKYCSYHKFKFEYLFFYVLSNPLEPSGYHIYHML